MIVRAISNFQFYWVHFIILISFLPDVINNNTGDSESLVIAIVVSFSWKNTNFKLILRRFRSVYAAHEFKYY